MRRIVLFVLIILLSLCVAPEIRSQSAMVQFAIIGDFGSPGQPELDVANLVKSWNPEFIVTVGDNDYSSGGVSAIDANIGQYYHDFIAPYKGTYGAGAAYNRFFPALGNHDWDTGNSTPYLDYFTLPGNERYFDFVRGPVHFFVIDSDPREPDGITSTSIQAAWLKNALTASLARWKVVLFHHPAYSSGDHGSTPEMQWPFKAWGANIVVSGHDHSYERLIVDGFPYITNGLGGNARITGFGTPLAGSVLRYNADFGAQLVVATDTSITFKFINRQGVLIDSYTLGTGSETPTSASMSISGTTLVAAGSTWKYYDKGTDPGSGWEKTWDMDSSWASGQAQLGYGDGDEATVVSYGPNDSSKHVTNYFRQIFNASGSYSGLKLRLLRDDGAVVYLNGTEVFRSNMPSGTITATTLAAVGVGDAGETTYDEAVITPAFLLNGQNLLAVEVHQSDRTSTDLSFDLELIGITSVNNTMLTNPPTKQSDQLTGTRTSTLIPSVTLTNTFLPPTETPSTPADAPPAG
jgi:tartrate-resistant acid phosphatase type 5